MEITLQKFGISSLCYILLLISFASCATTLIRGSRDYYVALSGAAEEVEMLTTSEANVVPFPGKYDTDVKAENSQRDAPDEPFKDSNGFIPVVVVVSVVVVVLIVVLTCCCYRRRKAKKNIPAKDPLDDISIESEEVPVPVPLPKDNAKPLKIVLMNKPEQKKPEQKPTQPLKDAKVNEVVITVPSHGKENTVEHPKMEIANELLDAKSDKVHEENEVLGQKSEILGAAPAILQQDNETLRSNSVASSDSGGIKVSFNHEDHVLEDKDSLHDENKDLDEKVNEVLSDMNEILSVEEVMEDKLDSESHGGSRTASLHEGGSTHSEVKHNEKEDARDDLDRSSTREPSVHEHEQEKSDSDNDEPSVTEAIAESSAVAAFTEEHQEEKPQLDKGDKDKEDKRSISSDENETENDNLNKIDSVANKSDRDHENPNVARDSTEKDHEEDKISH